VSYSRVDSFEYTGSKVEEDVRNFRVSAETNPRILVIARKEWRNEIDGFLTILAVVFPSLKLLLNPESRRE
jgi:Ser/Thr protein kinase RdoA (MazF antagonist)